jgi:hypothetical protein
MHGYGNKKDEQKKGEYSEKPISYELHVVNTTFRTYGYAHEEITRQNEEETYPCVTFNDESNSAESGLRLPVSKKYVEDVKYKYQKCCNAPYMSKTRVPRQVPGLNGSHN